MHSFEIPLQPVLEHEPYEFEGNETFEETDFESALTALFVDGDLIGLSVGSGSVVNVPLYRNRCLYKFY
jgi:hypothetical protein